jgi:hypothetical protein
MNQKFNSRGRNSTSEKLLVPPKHKTCIFYINQRSMEREKNTNKRDEAREEVDRLKSQLE